MLCILADGPFLALVNNPYRSFMIMFNSHLDMYNEGYVEGNSKLETFLTI